MSKTRYINTIFWDDEYIVSLSPEEKLLFLYFLTNPLTNIAGCYQITKKRISFDTNIDYDSLSKAMDKFSKDNKIYYFNGWIFIRNFIKNQIMNPKVKEGIVRVFKEIESKNIGITINYDSLSIDYDSLCIGFQILNSNSNSNLNLNSNLILADDKSSADEKIENDLVLTDEEFNSVEITEVEEIVETIGNQINKLIKLFEPVNISYEKFFSNLTQRKVLERLIKKWGFEKIEELIIWAIENQDQYTAITTPLEFENNVSKIMLRKKTNVDNNKNKIKNFDE